MQKWNMTSLIVPVILVGLVLVGTQFVLAQGPPNDGKRSNLRGLQRALEQVGGAELSVGQQEGLKALISDFRTGFQGQEPGEMRAVHEAYNAAILAGDINTAEAQAEVISALSTDHIRARLSAEAGVKIKILGILTAAQIDAISAHMGFQGLNGILSSLVSPRGRRGQGQGAGKPDGRGSRRPRGGGRGPGAPPPVNGEV